MDGRDAWLLKVISGTFSQVTGDVLVKMEPREEVR